MAKVLRFIRHEFMLVLPPTLFFLVAFNVITLTKALMLREHGIDFAGFGVAALGALVVGKVVLVADKLPLINKFPEKPLMYNVIWKTVIYVVAAFLVRYVEHLIPFVSEFGNLVTANNHLLHEVIWPRFWSTQIWLLVLFFVYACLRELIRYIGREQV
ncbi:MAG: hypothetical protein V7750_12255, partial [Sneathiella sp.]